MLLWNALIWFVCAKGSKSLRATISGLNIQSPHPRVDRVTFSTTMLFMDKSANNNTKLLIQNIIVCYWTDVNKSHHRLILSQTIWCWHSNYGGNSAQKDWFSCQVCDSVMLTFLTHGLRHLFPSFIEWSVLFPFTLLPSNVFFGERGGACSGRRWCRWAFSRWSKLRIEPQVVCLVQ